MTLCHCQERDEEVHVLNIIQAINYLRLEECTLFKYMQLFVIENKKILRWIPKQLESV